MIGRLDWIDKEKLTTFILASQDIDLGGIGDRPGNLADPFHTLFGMAGLSLLSSSSLIVDQTDAQKSLAIQKLKAVNPVFCMPQEVIDRLGLFAPANDLPNKHG